MDSENTVPPPALAQRRSHRQLLFAFGWLNVGLGAVGVVVPGLPTTPFLLVALWAFSRSSSRFQTWLWSHPRFGPPVRDWHAHGVIRPTAKITAVVVMAISLAIIIVFIADNWILPTIVGAIMAGAATFVLTRPSRPPIEPEANDADA